VPWISATLFLQSAAGNINFHSRFNVPLSNFSYMLEKGTPVIMGASEMLRLPEIFFRT
jgi:hypothetical protein